MRIVSLVPSITEALSQLGLMDQVVGITDYCLHPADALADKARIGGTKDPDLARIRDLHPDLVIANTDEQRTETLTSLADGPYDVLVTETDSLADVTRTWTQLGAATGTEERAERERHRLEVAVAAARAHVADHPRIATLVPVWKDPWMATGGGTYIEDLLDACGFDNVFSHLDDKWIRFQPTTDTDHAKRFQATQGPFKDQVVHALPHVPDAVLLPTEPYAFTDEHRGTFTGLGVPPGQVRVVDGELLTWWLSKSVDALATFSALHEELIGARASPPS